MSVRRYDPLKRLLDIVLGAGAMVALAPVTAAVAVAVRVKLGKPIYFRQARPGLNGKTFTILKFRTMLDIDEEAGRIKNEDRTHPFGERLRSTSLDELPSLWNVVKGDMSLVGPRPLRVSYLGRYSDAQARRHEVRPGLTGLAQVSGRNSLSWDERLQIDQQYVANQSFLLDMRILAQTVIKTLRREGIAAKGQATMSEFFGPQATERLRLIELSREHLPVRVEWLRTPEVSDGISLSFYPELEETEQWFERAVDNERRMDWVGTDADGAPKSMCGLTEITDEAAELYIYVCPDELGQGYGRETMHLLMAKARELGLSSLNLQTKSANERSRKLYESLGFEVRVASGDDPAMIAMTVAL